MWISGEYVRRAQAWDTRKEPVRLMSRRLRNRAAS